VALYDIDRIQTLVLILSLEGLVSPSLTKENSPEELAKTRIEGIKSIFSSNKDLLPAKKMSMIPYKPMEPRYLSDTGNALLEILARILE